MAKGKRKIESWQEQEIKEVAERRRGRRDVPEGMMPEEDLRVALAQETGAKIINLDLRRPVPAVGIHSGPEIPKTEEKENASKTEPVAEDTKGIEASIEASKEYSHTDETGQMKLAEVEAKIESEFSDAEKEFKDLVVKKYIGELQAAKNKIEKGGGVADDKWASVFRQSYIDSWKRFGIQKDKWGANGPLASEKAELLEKYLELKLPVGIPEEKTAASAEKNENVYSGEKSSEFLRLLRIASGLFREWFRDSEEWGPEFGDEEARKKTIFEQLQTVLPALMAQDPELKKHFTEKDIPRAVERAMNYMKQFNMKS